MRSKERSGTTQIVSLLLLWPPKDSSVDNDIAVVGPPSD